LLFVGILQRKYLAPYLVKLKGSKDNLSADRGRYKTTG